MKKIIVLLLITFLSISFISDVQAKRFGGGRSFGASRATNTFSRSPTQAISKPFAKARSWLGPLAGLALGGILASLFMGHGFASGMMSWIAILAVIFLITAFIRRKFQPAPAMPNNNNNQFSDYQASSNRSPFMNLGGSSSFNESEFLRQAKATFIRLQAAYDNKNLNDIRQFTTPEVFAEIQLQIQERGNAVNVTDVVSIQAELAENNGDYVSVRFSGYIKESEHESPVAITEIWHFTKDQSSTEWKVAGIQQELEAEKVI